MTRLQTWWRVKLPQWIALFLCLLVSSVVFAHEGNWPHGTPTGLSYLFHFSVNDTAPLTGDANTCWSSGSGTTDGDNCDGTGTQNITPYTLPAGNYRAVSATCMVGSNSGWAATDRVDLEFQRAGDAFTTPQTIISAFTITGALLSGVREILEFALDQNFTIPAGGEAILFQTVTAVDAGADANCNCVCTVTVLEQ